MALLALVLGVFGAVYFQGNAPGSGPQVASNASTPPQAPPPAATQPEATAPQASAPPENKPQDQEAASPDSNPASATASAPQTAQASSATPVPTAPDLSQTLLQNQISNTSPSPDSEAPRLAEISPSAAPANVASAAPRYWVEFGAYDTSYYADHLKRGLSQLGIEATTSIIGGKDGRTYLRVRTSGDSDRATATTQLSKAQSALLITPLLHRAAAVSLAPTRAPEAQAKPVASGGYWVQFGAFRERSNADTMLSQLRKKDIQAIVTERKNSNLQPFYLVRTSGLSDPALAAQTAQLGGSATRTSDAFIGQDRSSPSPPNAGLKPRLPSR